MLPVPVLVGRDAGPVVRAEDCIMGVREKVELVCKGVISGCCWDRLYPELESCICVGVNTREVLGAGMFTCGSQPARAMP